jgi:hypothetical protein
MQSHDATSFDLSPQFGALAYIEFSAIATINENLTGRFTSDRIVPTLFNSPQAYDSGLNHQRRRWIGYDCDESVRNVHSIA